jgi:hypothetical protein
MNPLEGLFERFFTNLWLKAGNRRLLSLQLTALALCAHSVSLPQAHRKETM